MKCKSCGKEAEKCNGCPDNNKKIHIRCHYCGHCTAHTSVLQLCFKDVDVEFERRNKNGKNKSSKKYGNN